MDDPCCGNPQWNGLPMGFEFTIGLSMHMPMGFVFIIKIPTFLISKYTLCTIDSAKFEYVFCVVEYRRGVAEQEYNGEADWKEAGEL